MTIFTNNKSIKFCQITLHIKNVFIKEKWFLFLPHGVRRHQSRGPIYKISYDLS